MAGQICLITGATSGIGKATAFALARLGATVIVHGRNREKCNATVSAIRQETGNQSIEPIVADFSSLEAVRGMAAEFRQRHSSLHVLINNAGISLRSRRTSRDGYELMFAVNHLAPFLLTNLLLETVIASAPARIIAVSSGLHKYSRLNLDDLQMERKFSAMRGYGVSKLANVMFTNELARRLEGKGVTANAMNPGMTATNIGMEEGGVFSASKRLMDRLIGKSPERGAETLIYLASAPEVAAVSGKYYDNMKETDAVPAAYDPDATRRFWEVSARLTGLAEA